jgi:O-antigen/teichoic acid export membrane protein
MKPSWTDVSHRIVHGTIHGFLAEGLFLLSGLISTVFLTRRLGPQSYGLFILTATLVTWIEGTITSVFARPTFKFIAEAEDWRPVGATVVQLHLTASGAIALLLWLLASPIAALLNESALASYLRLFALDIPLFSLARAHQNILVGIGRFNQRAFVGAGRWITRLLLIVILVELGLSVPGAILGSIGASLVELGIGRFYVRPSLFCRSTFLARRLWGYAGPLFLSALSLALYSKLDLFALKMLGGTATQAGIYGAAQNMSLVASVFAFSFSPLLLSTLSRVLHEGDNLLAKEIGCNAMRTVIGLLPFAGLAAGAAPEIIGLIFGPTFLPAAPLLALLIFGALALVMISITTAILAAAGKPGWTFALTGPLVPLAIAGHLIMIPWLGALGASLVTTLLASAGASAAVLAVYRLWQIFPSAGTLCRSVLLCGLAYALAALWPAPGFLLLLKLPAVGLLIVFAFVLLGEFSASEIALARAMLSWRTTPRHTLRELR